MADGSERGGVEQQAHIVSGHGEDLAVELEFSDDRVNGSFRDAPLDLDLTLSPQRSELRAVGGQFVNQSPDAGITWISAAGAQVGHALAGQLKLVANSNILAIEQPP